MLSVQPCTAVGDWRTIPPFFLKLFSSQTCFTPLESENWRHGSVKNWTTVPLSPWGTSRMLARQGLPVKSMFCLWGLCSGEYANATCYRPSAQSCAYFIQQLMGFGWSSLSWTGLHLLLQWLRLKAASHDIFIQLNTYFFCWGWFKKSNQTLFKSWTAMTSPSSQYSEKGLVGDHCLSSPANTVGCEKYKNVKTLSWLGNVLMLIV